MIFQRPLAPTAMTVSLAAVLKIPIRRLLADHAMSSYDLANALKAHGVSERTAYRLVDRGGELRRYDTALIEALMQIFKLKKLTDLFEYSRD